MALSPDVYLLTAPGTTEKNQVQLHFPSASASFPTFSVCLGFVSSSVGVPFSSLTVSCLRRGLLSISESALSVEENQNAQVSLTGG